MENRANTVAFNELQNEVERIIKLEDAMLALVGGGVGETVVG